MHNILWESFFFFLNPARTPHASTQDGKFSHCCYIFPLCHSWHQMPCCNTTTGIAWVNFTESACGLDKTRRFSPAVNRRNQRNRRHPVTGKDTKNPQNTSQVLQLFCLDSWTCNFGFPPPLSNPARLNRRDFESRICITLWHPLSLKEAGATARWQKSRTTHFTFSFIEPRQHLSNLDNIWRCDCGAEILEVQPWQL